MFLSGKSIVGFSQSTPNLRILELGPSVQSDYDDTTDRAVRHWLALESLMITNPCEGIASRSLHTFAQHNPHLALLEVDHKIDLLAVAGEPNPPTLPSSASSPSAWALCSCHDVRTASRFRRTSPASAACSIRCFLRSGVSKPSITPFSSPGFTIRILIAILRREGRQRALGSWALQELTCHLVNPVPSSRFNPLS